MPAAPLSVAKPAAQSVIEQLQAAKRGALEVEDWQKAFRKFQGTGVSYLSAPTGTATYNAVNLVR